MELQVPLKLMGEPKHQRLPLTRVRSRRSGAINANAIVLNRQAKSVIERLKAHLNATGAIAWKRVLHRVGHKLIEDQTQEHGLVHVQREAVGFAPDHDGPAMR